MALYSELAQDRSKTSSESESVATDRLDDGVFDVRTEEPLLPTLFSLALLDKSEAVSEIDFDAD